MARSILSALLAAAALCLASSAHALSCRGRIVHEGDSPARVRALCGEPASVSSRVVERSQTVHRRAADGVVISDTISVTVQVDEWVYDFGPRRFMQELTFEDGTLRAIRPLGYGTPEGREVRAPSPRRLPWGMVPAVALMRRR